ncbi:MAG: alpha/beta fold hydrolase [Deltaproteobacteria bacterium]|nr:alpha/beta fold hydrolase [Nannocystaceae bacterium]
MKLPILSLCLLASLTACGRPKQAATKTPAPAQPKPAPRVDPDVMLFAGEVATPGTPLPFAIELLRSKDGYGGKIQLPTQGARDLPLTDVVVSAERIEFGIAQVGAKWSVTRDANGEPSACSFAQGPAKLECTMAAVDAKAYQAINTPKRPQEPKPPFEYDAIEVTYENAAGGVKMAGTLTVPPGAGPFPVALLITGSGVQDRDESILGHKPFWVIADHLARNGIAALRVDDRGIGGSTGDPAAATTEDFVGDALAGVAFLATQARIDPKRIGLIGHSEGGLVAPAAAARSKQVAFVVMLAGPGVSGAVLLPKQVERLLQSSAVPEAQVAEAVAQQTAIMKIVAGKQDDATARKQLTALLSAVPDTDADVLASEIDRLMSPWFRNFAKYDPAPALAKVKVPMLALNGDLDVQVDAVQNTSAITKATKRNRKVTVERMPGLNHLFQHAQTGGVAEYSAIEETIAPEVLERITTWIRETTSAPRKP